MIETIRPTMKGYVLLVGGHKGLSSEDAIVASCPHGRFVPRVSSKSPVYGPVVADLMSARPGDKVFFFRKRGLFGVCSIVEHHGYPLAGAWIDKKGNIGLHLKPSKLLLSKPLDMDDLLMRPGNEIADGVRLMGGRSFFQLDPDETSWLEEQFYRRRDDQSTMKFVTGEASLMKGVDAGSLFPLSLQSKLFKGRVPPTYNRQFASESFLHVALLEHLQHAKSARPTHLPEESSIVSLHHEYPASPAKQASYVDRIDVVRTWGRTIGAGRTIPVFYECWELKRGKLNIGDFRAVVRQGMKYVDYVTQSKMNGDFGRVSLRIVARGFPESDDCRAAIEELGTRRYQVGLRESVADEVWQDVALMTYSWSASGLQLDNVQVGAME